MAGRHAMLSDLKLYLTFSLRLIESFICPHFHSSVGGALVARSNAAVARTQPRVWRDTGEVAVIAAARNGDERAMDTIIRRYEGFVRLKASSYFLAGGDSHDLIQEGLVGLFKAVRDYRSDRDTSFRSFAELCITRQIITAIRDGDSLQARAAEQLRLLQPHTGRPGVGDRLHARRRPTRPGRGRSRQLRDLDRGAAEPAPVPGQHAVRARVAGADLLSRGPQLRADRRAARAATPRRSTTPCSASSERCSPTCKRGASRPRVESRSSPVESAMLPDSSAGRAFAL